LTFVLSLLQMLQLCVAYIEIQISYHIGVDFPESPFWRAWERIYIQIFFMSAVAFDTVELFFSISSLQNKPKQMRKNSTGLWLFLCTWMIMTDSMMLSKAAFNGKYPAHPLSQLKMQLMRTYQNIVHLDAIVELGLTFFVDYCIYKVSRTLCINILQPSPGLEANNLEFCLEDFFNTRAIVESRNFISLKPDLNISSSVNLFEDPSAFFSSSRNTVADQNWPLLIAKRTLLSLLNLFIGHYILVSWLMVWKLWVLERFLRPL
jgi:hypothetical protein